MKGVVPASGIDSQLVHREAQEYTSRLLKCFQTNENDTSDLRNSLAEQIGDIKASEESPWPVSYALASLTDELMIERDEGWTNDLLESRLFGSNCSGVTFWKLAEAILERARRRDRLPHESAKDLNELKLFYSCVALGFRGSERKEEDGWYLTWVEEAARILDRSPERRETSRPTPVRNQQSRLEGRRRLRTMVCVGLIVPFVLLVIIIFSYIMTNSS